MPRVRNMTISSSLEKDCATLLRRALAPYVPAEPRLLSGLILLFLCMGLAACNDDTPPPKSPVLEPPATAQPTATSGMITEPGFIMSPVFVDEIEILLLESFPVQVYVRVIGNLATPCSEIVLPEQIIGPNNLIMLTMFSRQKNESACVQVLEPFEGTFALDVLGLPAGTYEVKVNGIVEKFILMADNGAAD